MTFAEKIKGLYERFSYLQKDGRNSHFKYKFVGEAGVKRELNAALREFGLILMGCFVDYTGDGKAGVAKVRLDIRDAEPDSQGRTQSIMLEGVGGGMDSSDKAPQKAMVAAFKYALMCGLSVATGDDAESDRNEDGHINALLALISERESLRGLNELKPDVAAYRDTPRFEELRAAFKRRAEQLTKEEADGK